MLKVTPIPAFENNYFWVIQPAMNYPGVVVVDPGDAAPVKKYLQSNNLNLKAILITHRHRDHIGGVNELLSYYPVEVYGPYSEAIPQVSMGLEHDCRFDLVGLHFNVIAVPGHTWEHIAYYLPDHNMVFCGDALFAGGCGRRFDGTAEIMWQSLRKVAALPEETLVYCAHEYTLANLQFASAVEPENEDLASRLGQVELLRSQNQVTLPTTILLEKRTNPFLRCDLDSVKRFIKTRTDKPLITDSDYFGALRSIKDTWPM